MIKYAILLTIFTLLLIRAIKHKSNFTLGSKDVITLIIILLSYSSLKVIQLFLIRYNLKNAEYEILNDWYLLILFGALLFHKLYNNKP